MAAYLFGQQQNTPQETTSLLKDQQESSLNSTFKERLQECADRGLTYPEVAVELQVPVSYCYSQARRFKIKIKSTYGKCRVKQSIESVLKLRESGQGYRAIGRALGVSATRVHSVLESEGYIFPEEALRSLGVDTAGFEERYAAEIAKHQREEEGRAQDIRARAKSEELCGT